ncbi:MAG TPA: hypothetical protein VF720_08710 [Candidatus Eisenbacteria bacterium]
MTRVRVMQLSALAVTIAAPATWGAVSADIAHLPLRRPVMLVGERRARAVIDEDSLLAAGAAPEFVDVRLMNAQGEAIALAAEPLRRMDEQYRQLRNVPLRWQEEANGPRRMVIDLGPDPPAELILAFEGPVANHSIAVEGSADSVGWSSMTQRYDLTMPPPKDNRLNTQRIALAETRRWLRVRQDPPYNAPTVDDRLDLMLRLERSTPRVAVGYQATSGFERSGGYRWEARLTLSGPARALTRLDVSGAEAVRSQLGFELQARLPKGGWQYVALERGPEWKGGANDSLLFAPVRTTELRVVVTGGDAPNPPVALHSLWATPVRWTFDIGSGDAWWLAWGDPFLAPAAGGLTMPVTTTNGADPATISPTRLGAVEPNPFHREPGFGLEWLRRRPIVLSVAMVAILALVAWLARRPKGRSGAAA